MILVEKLLETDVETGLDRYCQITSLNIDGLNEMIKVNYRIVLLTPTKYCAKIEVENHYTRFNGVVNKKFDQLEQSEIGQGLEYLLGIDLEAYPNFAQN